MLPTISRTSLRADQNENAKLECSYDCCRVVHNVAFNIKATAHDTRFDFMESTQRTALEMLLKANKSQKFARALKLRYKESSISERSEKIIFQSVKWKMKKVSRSLWSVGGKC